MKKILMCLMIFSVFLISGCSTKSDKSVINKLNDKINDAKSYYLTGNMEIINNEDTYTYDIEVSYKKGDYYKIDLVNNLNNHEQVILRNDDGVYIITPSLNKSYKFQSDWPYNNSQVYLLSSIYDDISTDDDRSFKKTDKGYVFTSSVNYPNNKALKKQNVYINSDMKVTKVEVTDKDGNVLIKMSFKKIEFNKKFDDNYFELSSIISTSDKKDENKNTDTSTNNTSTTNNGENNTNTTNTSTNNNENNTSDANNSTENNNSNTATNNSKTTANIDDIMYPMYLPSNTYLTSEDTINTDGGKRLILTFGGDSSFILVEEVANYNDSMQIIPVSGELEFLSDVIGVVSDKSVMWNSRGVDYYITSDTIKTAELIEIAKSISVLPVSK